MEFPVTYNSQDEFDAAISSRINRERDRIKRESGSSEELEQAQSRVAELERDIQTRDARAVLADMGVQDQGRQDRILKLSEIPDDYDDKSLREAFKATYDEIPEAFPSDAQVKDKGLDTSESDDSSGPITREQVEKMGPEEINSRWDQVKAFLGGERN